MEFVLGKYDKKGAVTFVLDMMVTDDECWTIQHMLHEIEEFGILQNKCAGERTSEGASERVLNAAERFICV